MGWASDFVSHATNTVKKTVSKDLWKNPGEVVGAWGDFIHSGYEATGADKAVGAIPVTRNASEWITQHQKTGWQLAGMSNQGVGIQGALPGAEAAWQSTVGNGIRAQRQAEADMAALQQQAEEQQANAKLVAKNSEDFKRRRSAQLLASAVGRGDTLLTGSLGLTDQASAPKTLLGG